MTVTNNHVCEIIEQLQKIKQPTQKTINICHVSANIIFKERVSIYITIIQDFVVGIHVRKI